VQLTYPAERVIHYFSVPMKDVDKCYAFDANSRSEYCIPNVALSRTRVGTRGGE
jgi:hypothetical protein